MVLLQTGGPSNWNNYEKGIYAAMGHYFTAIRPSYERIAQRLAYTLDQVCASIGAVAIGGAYQAFALGKLANAQAAINNHLATAPTGLGPNYTLQRL
jgi:hypothetical protein